MSKLLDEFLNLATQAHQFHAGALHSCHYTFCRDRYQLHADALAAGPPAVVVQSDLEKEIERLKNLINTPHTKVFLDAVPLEAAHQIERWGVEHDIGKAPEDWFWLLGYLAGKCLRACITDDVRKAKHHTISVAAVCLNWHRRLSGEDQTFQPGHGEIAKGNVT